MTNRIHLVLAKLLGWAPPDVFWSLSSLWNVLESFIVTVMSIGETAQVGGAFLLEVCGLLVVVSVTVLVIMIPYDEVVALPRRDVIGTVSLCVEMNHSKPSFVRIPC